MTNRADRTPNRLLKEKSPYLLQHAYNPVDWFPWGPEAFEKARAENKPILVSIGYSTCHWCHVMERESYEDPKVAELMNRDLVNIKVDREERPDVDKIYMTAVSAMTGSGGWPLNVFLTPDLKPFYGGTYFPPTARWGQPAWSDVVSQVSDAWKDPDHRKKMEEIGNQISASLQQYAAAAHVPSEGQPERLGKTFEALQATYDAERGGFGPAPKFPMPVYHNFLLRYYARTKNKAALEMSLHTLREMAKGGIYDHLGGGFARYATDGNWHVPHFEKMLYDNAQLAINYLEAYQCTRDLFFAQVARETLDYILRDMTRPDGGFFSAEDADSLARADASEKTEGAFYVWEKQEIMDVLGDEAGALFCFRYGVREGGNAASDPHGEFRNKNILYLAHPIPEVARHFKKTEAQTLEVLKTSRESLMTKRSSRPRPHLDDKILTAWNGLMISAFSKGSQVLGEVRYREAAERAATFARAHLYDEAKEQLFRRWRDGENGVKGTADDYSFLTQGLLDLYEVDGDPRWLQWSERLTHVMLSQFEDAKAGGFYMTAADQDKHLLVRVKEDMDNVEPSASSVMALNLLRLHEVTDLPLYQTAAQRTLRAFGGQMSDSPRAMPQMLVALDWALTEPRQIVIAGKPGAPDTEALLAVLNSRFLPVKTVLLADGGAGQTELAKRLPFIADMHPVQNKAAAYVCVRHTCKQPTVESSALAALLDAF